MNHIRFFFGTPVRMLVTLGSIAFLAITVVTIHLVWPGAIADAIAGTVREFTPLFNTMLYLAIMFGILVFGFRLMFRGVTGGNRGGRNN